MIMQAIKEKFVVHTVERRWRQLRCTPSFRRWKESARRIGEMMRLRARRASALEEAEQGGGAAPVGSPGGAACRSGAVASRSE